MAARDLIVFRHDSKLGKAPAHKLFDSVATRRTNGAEGPARSFADYEITVDETLVPEGVQVLRPF
jgi:CRISPR-associated protein Csd2